MLLNSIPFLVLVLVTWLLYWLFAGKSPTGQNYILLTASYIFYFSWEPTFLLLLVLITLVTWKGVEKVGKTKKESLRRIYFILMTLIVLLPLGVFKYLGFINELFSQFIPVHVNSPSLLSKLLLPLGISFYTFKILAYLFEVYNGRLQAESKFIPLALYLSFFPQIMAGPIERPGPFLTQVKAPKTFNQEQVKDGLLQILWGFFKKYVLANSLNAYVSYTFQNYTTLNPAVLALGSIYFYLQLYFDFSGYSDIAIGTARLFNLTTIQNFRYPLFAVNISDYWKRWHISLSSWLNDYLFTPLSLRFRYYGKAGLILSILILFTISGLWHGAGLTFLIWGIIQGLFYIPLILKGQINGRTYEVTDEQKWPRMLQVFFMLVNFILICLTLIVFKSPTLKDAGLYMVRIFQFRQYAVPRLGLVSPLILVLTGCSIITDWAGRTYSFSLKVISSMPAAWKYAVCYLLAMLIILTGVFESTQFIYNKF